MDGSLRQFGEHSITYGLDLLAIGSCEFHGGGDAGRKFENGVLERGGIF